jgi:type II secretory pathway component PulK
MKSEYFYGTENFEGIRNYVTVGPVSTAGKININTASEMVLKGISEHFNDDVVSSIIACRPFSTQNFSCVRGLDLSDGSDESNWIKNNVLVVKSSRFSVEVKGAMPSGAQVNVKSVLERINNNARIVYYRIH